MKKYLCLVIVWCITAYAKAAQPVNQEICYTAKGANEVNIVWGINNWQCPDKNQLPPGSYIKDNLVHTYMIEKEEGVFSVNLQVAPGTIIDYVFWITKGPLDVHTDIWDANIAPQKDYHTLAANDNTTIISSHSVIKPKQQLSLLDYAGTLFFVMIILTAGFYALKQYRLKTAALNPGPYKIVLGSGGVILLILFLVRATVSLLGWDLYYEPLEFMPKFLWSGYYDHLYVVSVTLLFVLLLFLFRKFPFVQKTLVFGFIVIGLISVVAGILNIRVVDMLGKPFNYRWFYYSGFLNSNDSKAALANNISLAYVFNVTIICISTVMAGIIAIYFIEWFLQKYKLKKIALISFIGLNIGYVVAAQISMKNYKWDYDKLANPVVAFLESVSPFGENPALYTMEVPDSLNMFTESKAKNVSCFERPSEKIKNVIVLVLESTPAEYIQPYDNKFKITPRLEEYLSQSIVFDNMYAHAPATNKSMVSLLASVYPWLSYASITQDHPDINAPTISSELKKQGYRTAFFNSGDNRFQKANEFLSHRRFDEIKDCKSLLCNDRFADQNNDWVGLDGINDECAGDAMLAWIKQAPDKPFFAMVWTYQTHYPYYATETKKEYVTHDSVLNRYLNAVNHSDMVLGNILDDLKQNGLFESTLVVVVGDHGEAFGRHNQTTHASKIYEENMHIPFILINPAFKSERRTEIGGMVDVAPTIMAMLGYPASEKWQGQCLFTTVNNRRTYFYCPWSDYLFGYREGDKKYIYNATKNLTEIYDLKNDPYETRNLATPEELVVCHQKLAAWVQYQNKFMDDLFAAKK